MNAVWEAFKGIDFEGRLKPNVDLAPYTWFRVGGPADIFFLPRDVNELQYLLAQKPNNVPVTSLGVGSNMIIRDGGIDGIVIRLAGKYWGTPTLLESDIIIAPAGALDLHIAKFAAQNGLSGLSFLSGIPGSIGGAIRTNAGCYGRELSDVLLYVDGIRHTGEAVRLSNDDFTLTYRHSSFPSDIVITHVALKSDGPEDVETLMKEIKTHQDRRTQTQPIKSKTSGSTFANPVCAETGKVLSAWKLIDQVGCRGLRVGGAQISEKHCNFLINVDQARATEIEALGELVRARVLVETGVALRWEVRRIGRFPKAKKAKPELTHSVPVPSGTGTTP